MNEKNLRINKNLLKAVLKEQNESFKEKDLGIERENLAQYEEKLDSPQILVITGLRRVGKSTLLAQLANRFLDDDYYFVNFEDERFLNFKVQHFDALHETLISLFGEKDTFLFDEVQNVAQWERFVRRLMDEGYKVVVTGSNASLLSHELGDRLTGRHIDIELFPFSYREFLKFEDYSVSNSDVLTTKERGKQLQWVSEYLKKGGIPDSLKYPQLEVHKTLYNDVLHRDIAVRYRIENTKNLKELTFYLMSNFASLASFNKLKQLLKLGSVNTVKKYIGYLENSWLIFVINKYAYSVKEQQIAPKKIYGIDNGLLNSVGFSFSEDRGRLLENQVFLYLRRRHEKIYYYLTEKKHQVDFYLPEDNSLWQVAYDFDKKDVKKRELRALVGAFRELKGSQRLVVVTFREKGSAAYQGQEVELIPLYKLLL